MFTCFSNVTEGEVLKCMKCSALKTCDLDAVPTSLLLDCAEVAAPYMMEIINLSLSTGTASDSYYRLAIIRPLLKKQDWRRTVLNISDLLLLQRSTGCIKFSAPLM